MSSTTYQGIPR